GRFAVLPLAIAVLACITSVVLYRPEALLRFDRIRSYAQEDALHDRLQSLVRSDEYAIFFNKNLPLYWLSERYPNWPVLHSDVQATYFVERHATELLRSFDDSRLALVEFDPDESVFNDPNFLRPPINRSFIASIHCRLTAEFTRRDD